MSRVDVPRLIASLERFGTSLPVVVADVDPADAQWRPPDEAWSIVEIVTHLADEETEDFGRRLRLTLDDPTAEWPPIDPAGWAVARGYRERSLLVEAERFAVSRAASVRWLRERSDADWSTAHVHPRFGSMRAGDLLTAWVAHDALHLRQIAKRFHQLAARDGAGFESVYAGEWS